MQLHCDVSFKDINEISTPSMYHKHMHMCYSKIVKSVITRNPRTFRKFYGIRGIPYTVLLRISARAHIYFVHPLDPALIQAPALIFFIRYFDPALFFLFTTLTGTFIFATTENVSSIKKG